MYEVGRRGGEGDEILDWRGGNMVFDERGSLVRRECQAWSLMRGYYPPPHVYALSSRKASLIIRLLVDRLWY